MPLRHRKRPPAPLQHQKHFAFDERSRRLQRRFKTAIVLGTSALLVAGLAASPKVRFGITSTVAWAQQRVLRDWIGLPPSRDEIDSLRNAVRQRTEEETRSSLVRFYGKTTPEIRRMFDTSAMDPAHGLIGVGRANNGFLLSSEVFAADANGRSYRLKPNVTSVWLRQVTLHEGPFGLFLVPDRPDVREAAGAAGAIVDDTSRQTTNSWGLRGSEPDLEAPLRGIVLGDSFMQGMFNSDEHTPPLDLERALAAATQKAVSVLNTGHIGYCPEQYYFTLKEYGPRFRPHFVVVSVCPNDFGDGQDVILGKGDDWDEAAHWLSQILLWCRGQSIPCLLVPAPVDQQLLGSRKDAYYPGRVSNLFEGSGLAYTNPFDVFVDEHLRLSRAGFPSGRSPLFNHQINDNHFSPEGSRLWAEVVARRLVSLIDRGGKSGIDRPTEEPMASEPAG
jgi:hypothetical protein